MEEKSPLLRLKELLPNLEGKVHLADQDLIKEVVVKEVIQKASGQNYFYRERFLKNTITYLEGIADNDPLYRADPQSRNLIRTAVSIIRQL